MMVGANAHRKGENMIYYNTDWNTFIAENHSTIFRMWKKGEEEMCEFVQIPWSITMPNGNVKIACRILAMNEDDNGIKPEFYPKDVISRDYLDFVDLEDVNLAFVPHDQIREEN